MSSGMNLSFYPQTSYVNTCQRSYSSPFFGNSNASAPNSGGTCQPALNAMFSNSAGIYVKSTESGSGLKSKEMRTFLKSLTQTSYQKDNPYAVTYQDKLSGFLEMSGSQGGEEDELIQKNTGYNYNEVANKIQQAKTPVSASQALISAQRKVFEVRRKLACGDGDTQELQLALTHALRMEMVARKKKHHLELEELVVTTQKRDEKLDQMEETVSDMKNAMLDAFEGKVTQEEDAVFDKRQELLDEIADEMEESGLTMSDERMSELNDMIAEFGEEELKELEETMEQLENLEIVDPHMSKEELEELKRKHRNAENKAIVKANMEYLKDMMKHTVEKGGSFPGKSGGLVPASAAPASAAFGVSAGMEAFAGTADVSMPSIDIQV